MLRQEPIRVTLVKLVDQIPQPPYSAQPWRGRPRYVYDIGGVPC